MHSRQTKSLIRPSTLVDYRPKIKPHRTIRNPTRRTGRNHACPCGSGKKFKRCCALKPAVSP